MNFVVEDLNNKDAEDNEIIISEKTSSFPQSVIDSNIIQNIKSKHKDSYVYGIWTTLAISGLLHENGLQIISEDENSGFYIYIQNREVVETGSYEHSHIASTHNLSLADAITLSIDVQDLIIPSKDIKSLIDIYQENQGKKKEEIWFAVKGVVIGLVIVGAVTFVLNFIEKEQDIEVEYIAKKNNSLITDINNLKSTKLETIPNQFRELSKIYNMYYISSERLVINNQNMSEPNRTAFLPGDMPNPKEGLQSGMTIKQYNPNTGWEIEW